jgi:hypothetical protein
VSPRIDHVVRRDGAAVLQNVPCEFTAENTNLGAYFNRPRVQNRGPKIQPIFCGGGGVLDYPMDVQPLIHHFD